MPHKNMLNMEEEKWMPIKGFEGVYEVSSLGNVRSLDRERKNHSGGTAKIKGKTLKPHKNSNNNYLLVNLRHDGIENKCLVHRLVAEAFIPNPNGLPQVNHKDENVRNNRTDNLEWCDQYYNNHYGTARERIEAKRRIPVMQYIGDTLIAEYPSAREAARVLGKSEAAISRCCNGIYKTAYGFRWRYKKEF